MGSKAELETRTEKVVQTVVLDLETSNSKNRMVEDAIDEYQEMLSHALDVGKSIDERYWGSQSTAFYRILNKEFGEERNIKADCLNLAANAAGEMYASWDSNGRPGGQPKKDSGNYIQIRGRDANIVENERGYGLKTSFIPYNTLWFHINPNPHSRKYIEKVIEGNSSVGDCELRLDGGHLEAHLSIAWEVEVPYVSDVDTVIGVDIGENVIYALSVLNENGISDVEMESGKEFRHYRERLKVRRARMMEEGDKRGVLKCSGEHDRYTEQVLDTASKNIIRKAIEHRPCKIVIEDLTNYRQTAPNAIHDWPYALLQGKIAYKAKAEGIPVSSVNPRHTSQTCRACGHQSRSNRNGLEFECDECGYEVHADVNASMNIALRGSDWDRDDFEVQKKLNRDSLLDF